MKPVQPLVIPGVVKPPALIVGPGRGDPARPAVPVGPGVGRAALGLAPIVGDATAVSIAVGDGLAVFPPTPPPRTVSRTPVAAIAMTTAAARPAVANTVALNGFIDERMERPLSLVVTSLA